jgi:tetratricopeptide (TPR) repeat protein
MTWIVLAASAAIAAVAAAGIMRPYRRGGPVPTEQPTDSMEDQRATLLRELRDLEEERARGALSETEHAALRAETEVRAVAVLRALEAREGDGRLGATVGVAEDAGVTAGAPTHARTLHVEPDRSTGRPARRNRGSVAAMIAGGALAAALVPILIASVSGRTTGGAITGDERAGEATARTSAVPADAQLAPLEQAVRDRPNDITARLDLAERYLRDGQDGLAALQFTEVLRREPRNADAHTGLALILLSAGRATDALSQADQALVAAPDDPDALYAKGMALVTGLDRRAEGERFLRQYLRAAPYGTHRDQVERVLAGAVAASGSDAPSSPGAATPAASASP